MLARNFTRKISSDISGETIAHVFSSSHGRIAHCFRQEITTYCWLIIGKVRNNRLKRQGTKKETNFAIRNNFNTKNFQP